MPIPCLYHASSPAGSHSQGAEARGASKLLSVFSFRPGAIAAGDDGRKGTKTAPMHSNGWSKREMDGERKLGDGEDEIAPRGRKEAEKKGLVVL